MRTGVGKPGRCVSSYAAVRPRPNSWRISRMLISLSATSGVWTAGSGSPAPRAIIRRPWPPGWLRGRSRRRRPYSTLLPRSKRSRWAIDRTSGGIPGCLDQFSRVCGFPGVEVGGAISQDVQDRLDDHPVLRPDRENLDAGPLPCALPRHLIQLPAAVSGTGGRLATEAASVGARRCRPGEADRYTRCA